MLYSLKPEVIVYFTTYFMVGLDDVFHLVLNEEVERVDMLLDKTLYFQKGW
jgi:hypothetical protein